MNSANPGDSANPADSEASVGPAGPAGPAGIVSLVSGAERLRSIADSMMANEIGGRDLVQFLDLLDAAQGLLDRYPHGSLYRLLGNDILSSGEPGVAVLPTDSAPAPEYPHAFGDHPFRLHSPVVGTANPVAPPAAFATEGERVLGTCTFGPRYEGAPGFVHGGFVGAVFDEALGIAQGFTGAPGMTAFLHVDYRRPHRLQVPIRFEAWVEAVEGRKIRCAGSSFDDETGELLAESSAMFITVDWAKLRQLAE